MQSLRPGERVLSGTERYSFLRSTKQFVFERQRGETQRSDNQVYPRVFIGRLARIVHSLNRLVWLIDTTQIRRVGCELARRSASNCGQPEALGRQPFSPSSQQASSPSFFSYAQP